MYLLYRHHALSIYPVAILLGVVVAQIILTFPAWRNSELLDEEPRAFSIDTYDISLPSTLSWLEKEQASTTPVHLHTMVFVLIYGALSLLSILCLRLLCISQGLDFFSLCPYYAVSGDRLTIFSLLVHIVSTISTP